MYDRKSQLVVDNPLDRYLINSAMLQDLKPDAEGNITLWLQKDGPGAEQEANWLPSGPVLNGSWTAEPVRKAV